VWTIKSSPLTGAKSNPFIEGRSSSFTPGARRDTHRRRRLLDYVTKADVFINEKTRESYPMPSLMTLPIVLFGLVHLA
jgi:hypothetical protein